MQLLCEIVPDSAGELRASFLKDKTKFYVIVKELSERYGWWGDFIMDICLKCGGTGVLINGEKCDCGCMDDFVLPTAMHIPSQYQNVRFENY